MSDSAPRKPETVAELIDAFGGAAAFARVIGKGPSTASEQKRAGRIPVEYWDLILGGAKAAGIPGLSYEALVKMHLPAERRSPVEARA